MRSRFLVLCLCLALVMSSLVALGEEMEIESAEETNPGKKDGAIVEEEMEELLVIEEEDESDVLDYEVLDDDLFMDAFEGEIEGTPSEESEDIDSLGKNPETNDAVSNVSYSVVYSEDCIYKVIKPFQLCVEPSKDAKKTGGMLWNNQTIHVVAVVKNQYNNMWLKTESGGFVYGGYCWKDNKWVKDGDQYVEFASKNNNVSWSDNNIAGKTLTYGKSYALSGTIRSSFTMYQIVGALNDGDTWQSTSGVINVNTTAYSVYGSALDMNLKFGTLPYSDQLKLKVQVQYYYDRGQKWDAHSFVFNFSNKDGIDRTPPSILGINISNVSSDGYTVTCNISDNKGISHVAFPSWTIQNGQDDLASDWGNTARGTISNGVATYRVNVSAHKNETGCEYVTHIYAWDTNGNQSSADAGTIFVPAKVISVTGVFLSKTSLSLNKGNTYTLSATVSPSNATNKSVSWTSSNTSVATVSSGSVRAIGAGTATITATTSDGGKKASCTVMVTDQSTSVPVATKIPVVGVSVSPTDVSMKVGATRLITATIYPSNATNKGVKFSSNNEEVAIIDSNGILAAVGVGETFIKATTEDGGYTALLTVTVKAVKPTKVKLNKSGTVKLKKGKKLKLVAKITPSNATTKLKWSSSNKKVATVSSKGVVKAKKKGTTTITVKTSNGKKAKVKIKVKKTSLALDEQAGK